MKTKVVLFGAGNNCNAIIKFLGSKNIYTIIDNDTSRWGTKVCGIEIISLSNFLDRKVFFPILITVTSETSRFKIQKQLQDVGIELFYYAPFIQFGFFENAQRLVRQLEMDKRKPIFYGNNPITDKIIEELDKNFFDYSILMCEESCYPLLNEEKETEHLISDKNLGSNNTIFITDDKQHNFNYPNNIVLNIMDEYHAKYLPKHKELECFKGIHKGKRCFLIGNGPSLTYEDLEQLRKKGEIAFGANRIYRSFDKTLWRPNYYLMVDSSMIQQDIEIIQNYQLPSVFIGDNYSENKLTGLNNCFYFSRMPNDYQTDCFSTDITQYVYGGSTVIYDAMQIAIYMGFMEIILLGKFFSWLYRCHIHSQ